MKKAKNIAMAIAGLLMAAGSVVCYRFGLNVTGGGLMGGGVVMIIMGLSRLLSKKAARDAEIEVKDERNKAIQHGTGYYSNLAVMFALAIGMMVFGELGDYMTFGVLAGIFAVQLISMVIARAVLKRKM